MKAPESKETRNFYSRLMGGQERRWLWGKGKRFSPETIASRLAVREWFLGPLTSRLRPGAEVLDFGCGPGTFFPLVAPLCASLTGVDIVPEFVVAAQALVARAGIRNATARLAEDPLPFPPERFDAVLMVDTIHHLAAIPPVLRELHRVLKPGGRLLVFEPNRHNPLLYLMCLLDPNERGLLSMGVIGDYRKMLDGLFTVTAHEMSGLLIGPDSRLSVGVTHLLERRFGGRLRWLLPKLFFVAEKQG